MYENKSRVTPVRVARYGTLTVTPLARVTTNLSSEKPRKTSADTQRLNLSDFRKTVQSGSGSRTANITKRGGKYGRYLLYLFDNPKRIDDNCKRPLRHVFGGYGADKKQKEEVKK